MGYDIQSSDFRLVKQHNIILSLKIEIYDRNNAYVNDIVGNVISGNGSISADSDVRRTFTLTLIPDRKSRLIISSQGLIWVDKKCRVSLGIKNIKNDEIKYWTQGMFVFSNSSSTYDATTNQLQISCSDFMTLFDGSKNGQLGQEIITVPAYDELLNSIWLDEAAEDGIDVSNRDAFFNWAKVQYPNKVTESNDTSVKQAGWELIKTVTSSLTDAQIMNDTNIIKNLYPRAEFCRNIDDGISHIVSHNIVREALIKTVTQLGRYKEYNVDEIGEPYGMPDSWSKWESYRAANPDWNYVPYDLEFSTGTNVVTIINEIRDLYPNYETYFNQEGVFCANMIPSLYDSDIEIEDSFIQDILVSENTNLDLTTVKNMVEIWGACIDVDFYQDTGVTLSGSTYRADISGYDDGYYNGDKIGLKVPASNPANLKIQLRKTGDSSYLEAIQVLDQNTGSALEAGILEAGETYVFKIKKEYKDGKTQLKAYMLGRWQAHAMACLVESATGDENDIYHTTSGTDVPRYSREYFQDVYNCEQVYLHVIPDSPFTVQKIGEVLQVCHGGTYENIQSSSVALSNARFDLWKYSRLTDNITITTKICPFADVNVKVSYQPKLYDSDSVHQYITKNVSHDMSSGTTSWTLMRFYPLYKDDDDYYTEWGTQDKDVENLNRRR